jgi:dihydrolipoamide dehydrogenase
MEELPTAINPPNQNEVIYDIAIIGSGPGGYHAALRAASYGAKVALIEKDTRLGGTCSNWGCIPTKALWSSAKMVDDIKTKAIEFGLDIPVSFPINFERVAVRKNKVVQELTDGIGQLCRAKKVSLFRGFGSFVSGNILSNFVISVQGQDNCEIKSRRVILATGSKPAAIPAFNIDHELILDSNDVLSPDFNKLPQSIIIIGGGVIGCEFATIFAEFGVKVILLEYLDTILANEEKLVVKTLKKKLDELKIEIHEGVNVLNVIRTENGVKATTISTAEPKDQIESAQKTEYTADLCLVSIGRQKYTEGLNLDKMRVVTERGAIKINHITMETSQPGIYAIGDCTGILMLAHFASYQGDIAVMNALSSIGGFEGVHPEGADFSTVPATTFTIPPIGSVGLREKEAKEKYGDILVGRFAYASSGKAKCMGETEGFMMVIADKKTDKIVGASCIGESAAELISEISVAMRLGLTTELMAAVIHSHPTLSEIALEAIEDVHGMAIHKAARRR